MKHLLIFLSLFLFSLTIISCKSKSSTSSTTTDKTTELLVSVGSSRTILTSTDGTTWTERTSGTSMYLEDITY